MVFRTIFLFQKPEIEVLIRTFTISRGGGLARLSITYSVLELTGDSVSILKKKYLLVSRILTSLIKKTFKYSGAHNKFTFFSSPFYNFFQTLIIHHYY